ncbi:hypothetical protein [Xanthomonas dyei]|uniref:hypothetical protein n=1 Tax=Xanthomonas dyei TaxID=743699 RepID=UPI001E3ECA2F|nr:hypothetical protein [Xanthomonas dyei]MCC4635269.1 hypothetical protein [Xanthomonas dyei pv. eucalypti]
MDEEFSYITTPELRRSLSSDYAEMQKNFKSQAWKSVQVLAGSIVEALLVDYLTWSNSNASNSKNPLNMAFTDLIDACKSQGAIKSATADMCSVIKTYRNLIHPGRLVRLEEVQPDSDSATVAVSLVNIINRDIENSRRKKAGLTAEQIYQKLVSDKDVIPVLPHLIAELSEHEKKRLLTEVLPQHNLQLHHEYMSSDGFGDAPNKAGFKSCYQEALKSSDSHTQTEAIKYFNDLILHGIGEDITLFRKTFFKATYLAYADAKQRKVIKSHLLGTCPKIHDHESSSILIGIAPYLEKSEITQWVQPHYLAIIDPRVKSSSQVKDTFIDEFWLLEPECRKQLESYLNILKATTEGRTNAQTVRAHLDSMIDWLGVL